MTKETKMEFNGSTFEDLMNGSYNERIEKGEKFMADLLPEAKKKKLKEIGVHCIAYHRYSPKNPQFIFSFVRMGKVKQVSCEVGKRFLCTDCTKEHLVSLEQLRNRIDTTISLFM